MSQIPLLTVKGLVKYFSVRKTFFGKRQKFVRAIDGVNLEIHQGQNLALVGESGCGKTTLGRVLCGLIPPTAGDVEYLGRPVSELDQHSFSRCVQPIFQDPYSALNPRKTVKKTITKPFKIHAVKFNEGTLCELLEHVGLSPGKSFLNRYPHELSGGQRQRVVIARALALNPNVIVADEPVSGLDPTVQIQILKLMKKLQDTYKTTYLIISHDISLVKSMSQRIAVMYLGKLVEIGPTEEVVQHPIHPYTVSLLRSFPSADPDERSWVDSPPIAGDIPSSVDPPSGCRFRTRCRLALPACAMKEPTLESVGTDHYVACPVVLGQNKS